MYNRRTWLNKENSSSTGNVVAFEKEITYENGDKWHNIFLSISDCHTCTRLHKSDDDTVEDFIDKMKILRNEIDLFINHLENSQHVDSESK